MSLGFGEILVVMFIILLLFGARKLPELAKGLGQGLREFKKATSEIQEELASATNLEEPVKKVKDSSTSEAAEPND